MIGVQGNEAAQARVFAHDATAVVTDARVLWLELDTLKVGTGYTAGTDGSIAAITGGNNDAYVTIRTTFPGSQDRGCCLYVGGAGDVEAVLESGTTAIFAGVNAGSFLPICATQVLSANTTATSMLALY